MVTAPRNPGTRVERGFLSSIVRDGGIGEREDLPFAGRENLLATYCSLAQGNELTSLVTSDGYTTAQGPLHLSFCNFAAGFEETSGHLGRMIALAERARRQSGLWVFVTDADRPPEIEADLLAQGFVRRHRQSQMVATAPAIRPPVPLMAAETLELRQDTARFMADQFFLRTGPLGRQDIASATARSDRALWRCEGPGGLLMGAVMVSESASAVGLYNLCVAPDRRGRGLGASLVAAVQEFAAAQGKPLVLQCDPPMEAWYARLGFAAFGQVTAYTYRTGL